MPRRRLPKLTEEIKNEVDPKITASKQNLDDQEQIQNLDDQEQIQNLDDQNLDLDESEEEVILPISSLDLVGDGLGKTINCQTRGGIVKVGIFVLKKMGRFRQSYARRMPNVVFKFIVDNIPKYAFIFIAQWCAYFLRNYGDEELMPQIDLVTYIRLPIELNEQERNFFDEVELFSDLILLIAYSRSLGIPSLRMLACQELASRIRYKTPKELRKIFNMLNNIDDDRKKTLKLLNNMWMIV